MRERPAMIARFFDLRDAFVFGGLAMVGLGLDQLSRPAALIVVGAVLFWLGVRTVKAPD